VILHLDDIHVAIAVEADLIGLIQFSIYRPTAIAGIPTSPAAGDRRQFSRRKIQAAHAMVLHLSDVHRAVRSDFDSEWRANVNGRCVPIVAVILRSSCSRNRIDLRITCNDRCATAPS
jgi:hypothetical protein